MGATQNYKLGYLFICMAQDAKAAAHSLPTYGILSLVYRSSVEIRGRGFGPLKDVCIYRTTQTQMKGKYTSMPIVGIELTELMLH
jgi:hypothetical protein